MVSSCRKAEECLEEEEGRVRRAADPCSRAPAPLMAGRSLKCSLPPFAAHLGLCGTLSWFCTARATLSPFWNTMS